MEKENIGLDKNIFCDDKKSDLSQGECIATDLTGNCEVVCLLSKYKDDIKREKKIEYREEEVADCACIYG